MSQAPRERDPSSRRDRKKRTHQRSESNGELLDPSEREPHQTSPSKSRPKPDRHRSSERRARRPDSENTKTTSSGFSTEQLAALDKRNEKLGWSEYDKLRPSPRREEVEDRRDKRALRDSGIRERDRRDRGGARDDDNEREIERRERARERERERRRQEHRERRRQRRGEERAADKATGDEDETRGLAYNESKRARDRPRDSQGRRVVSGQKLEQGPTKYYSDKEEFRDDVRPYDGSDSTNTDGDDPEKKRKLRRKIFIGIAILIVLLLIIIPVAVVVSKKKSAPGNDSSGTSSSQPGNSELDGLSESDLPKNVQGTILDPWTWYDTTSFNVTYTPETVGGLSVMGLMSTWDDSKQANANVPPLNQPFQYGTMKIRGVNLGGWLSIEPFITPSLFSSYNTHDGVVDEYTLTQTLGPMRSKSILEKHYATFVRESTFAEIQAAGFDHIRIPFSYWAVTTYDGDPYVPQVSWRYLLRAIEWARKYGLRINLDLHGAPGSQNGWNHSGRQGTIRWLNGTDGTLNGQRTIDIHKQLSTFFSQPRYKNIVTMYGLVNEPRMVSLNADTVRQWTQSAYTAVRASNFTGIIIFGDGFMGLDKWQGQLTSNQGLLLDVHQYTIFNVQQIVLNHHDKINFACGGWTAQALRSSNPSTGFGPTLCGEWSQADTDCARYLNNVGVGSRWEGTLNTASTPGGSADGSVLTPTCPTKNNPRCSCDQANADPSTYSPEYKQWLLMFAEAQMASFENGWGWFYWTWQTESAAQWSYRTGLAAGTLPQKAYARSFNCSSEIPQFASLGLPEYY